MKPSIIISAILVLGAGFDADFADRDGGKNPRPKHKLAHRGIPTTFMTRLELLTRDGFSRRNPPLPAEVAVKSLPRYDAIWAAQFLPTYNRPAWRLLRQRYLHILILWYMSSDSTRVYDNGHFDCEYIDTHHPEWFVLRDVNNPARANPRDPDNRIHWSRFAPDAPSHNRFC